MIQHLLLDKPAFTPMKFVKETLVAQTQRLPKFDHMHLPLPASLPMKFELSAFVATLPAF
jgi:hypothetical protein